MTAGVQKDTVDEIIPYTRFTWQQTAVMLVLGLGLGLEAKSLDWPCGMWIQYCLLGVSCLRHGYLEYACMMQLTYGLHLQWHYCSYRDSIRHHYVNFMYLCNVFCTPATSAPVERIFSQSGQLMRPHRARMSDSLLETLAYLKCNANVD